MSDMCTLEPYTRVTLCFLAQFKYYSQHFIKNCYQKKSVTLYTYEFTMKILQKIVGRCIYVQLQNCHAATAAV